VNSNGGTAIRVNGLTTSSFPAWSTGATLSNQNANTDFAVNLSATSDSNITYANTSALPAGTTLSANGYFFGTVSIDTQTTYTFDVKATDVENQDATRTFSLTVTIVPQTRLYVWGYNNQGQLGTNDLVNRSSPTQVGTDTNWNQVSTDRTHSIATKTDGTLWSWGYNGNGQLGLGNTTNYSSPKQLGALSTWRKTSADDYHTMGITTGGALWGWGYNASYGALGLDNKTNYSSPKQVGLLTTWSDVSTGLYYTLAAKTDGTLWSWGINDYGNLGDNTTAPKSSPIQIGSLTEWYKVAAGSEHAIALG
jgi:alpha-tubulin suppressor-like RCC1 family protein